MKIVSVPQTLDAPPRFLFWDFDYVLVSSVGFVMGCVISGVFLGIVFLFAFDYVWSRLRSGHGVNRALALTFWYLPFDLFTRVPASARRHFIG